MLPRELHAGKGPTKKLRIVPVISNLREDVEKRDEALSSTPILALFSLPEWTSEHNFQRVP